MNDFDLRIPRNNIYEIPNRKGIYVLFSDEWIPLYVGQSVNVKNRVTTHFTSDKSGLVFKNIERVYEIGIIFYDEIDNLDDIEQKYISLLKPILNIDKVEYENEIDIQKIRKHGKPTYVLCKHCDDLPCDKISTRNGYCYYHDPNKIVSPNVPSWIVHRKLITTEMQRLLYNVEYKRQPLYFYMSNTTFGKLLQEKTFAEIDYINEELVLKYKKHYIVIDEDEIVRLETR